MTYIHSTHSYVISLRTKPIHLITYIFIFFIYLLPNTKAFADCEHASSGIKKYRTEFDTALSDYNSFSQSLSQSDHKQEMIPEAISKNKRLLQLFDIALSSVDEAFQYNCFTAEKAKTEFLDFKRIIIDRKNRFEDELKQLNILNSSHSLNSINQSMADMAMKLYIASLREKLPLIFDNNTMMTNAEYNNSTLKMLFKKQISVNNLSSSDFTSLKNSITSETIVNACKQSDIRFLLDNNFILQYVFRDIQQTNICDFTISASTCLKS